MSKECILPVVSFCVERSILLKKRQSAAIPAFDILRFIILRFDILCKKSMVQV